MKNSLVHHSWRRQTNVITEIKAAYTRPVREYHSFNSEVFDPRKYTTPARNAMKAVICCPRNIRLFGSNNQA
ncbi:class II fructose-bisphosphate aldolase [Paenibacillus sp. LPE1-1-1.1]|uniref:class II fructose-bisphosphate aldolase n=1 Tax=Paenibacillus sp. LPE1-1-1.1 TaxID=3135230 RepID=UPI00343CDA5D